MAGGSSSASSSPSPPKLKVLFLHMDLGIGGAEQLVLQLALASQSLGHDVTLLTTRCDADHCFAAVKPPNGVLYKSLNIRGRWIPANFFGLGGTALCSNLRVLYLALWIWMFAGQSVDLVVLDVLPSPLWFLRKVCPQLSLLFYCHFPDKLLIRNSNNDNSTAAATTNNKSMYRKLMDALEDACMPFADLVLVNSQFTKETVLREFPSLQQQQQQSEDEQNNNHHHAADLQVLYPALDTAAMDSKQEGSSSNTRQEDDDDVITIVSLNRYERKKKIDLLLYAFASIQKDIPPTTLSQIRIIIAGGYDTKNVENVQHMGELQRIAYQDLNFSKDQVQFRTSISDAQRTHLLQTARCVVYTPPNEHFGIVPLEVMYAGTPVIACNSGGPLETIVHGVTGYLCDPSPNAFGQALLTLICDGKKAHQMGQAGRNHVQRNFGTAVLTDHWNRLTQQACARGRKRQQRIGRTRFSLPGAVFAYGREALVALLSCILLTYLLRQMGILEPEESIVGSFRRQVQNDEL